MVLIKQIRNLEMGDKDNTSFQAAVRQYGDETSAHGVPRIFGSRAPLRRLVWIILCLGGLAGFLSQASSLISEYFSFPVETTVKVTFSKAMSFPAVTMCNINPVRLSQLQNNTEFKQQLGRVLPSSYFNDILNTDPDIKNILQSIMRSQTSAQTVVNSTKALLQSAVSSSGGSSLLNSLSGSLSSTLTGFSSGSSGRNVIGPPGGSSSTTDNSVSSVKSDVTSGAGLGNTGSGGTHASQTTGRDLPTTQRPQQQNSINNVISTIRKSTSRFSSFGKRRRRAAASDNKTGNASTSSISSSETSINDVASSASRQTLSTTANFVGAVSRSIIRDRYQSAVAHMDEEEKSNLGHQYKAFITRCLWNGGLCEDRWFINFHTYDHGNCFTFNHGQHNTTPLVSTRSGSKYGLEVIFNVEPGEYVRDLTEENGVRVSIHEPGVQPFPDEDGMDFPTGFSTRVGLKRAKVSRRPYPYGECTYGEGKATLSGYKYTVKACQKICLYDLVKHHCNCALLDSGVGFLRSGNMSACFINSDPCPKEVWTHFLEGLDGYSCDCPESCEDIAYTTQISSSRWPSASSMQSLSVELDAFNDVLKDGDSLVNPAEMASMSFAKLTVFYQEMNFEEVSERPSYEIPKLLGDMGGQMGLWIGVSVLTLCELLELFVDLAILLFIKLTSKGEFSPSKAKGNKVAATNKDNVKIQPRPVLVGSADGK